MSDIEIVQQVLDGDTERYRYLVEKYQDMVFGIAKGFVYSKDEAEDLSQEIFIKVFQNLSSFKGEAKFSTWLYRISVNMALNYKKRLWRRNFRSFFEENPSELLNKTSRNLSPHEQMEHVELEQAIQKAVDGLNVKQRTAFILSKYQDLSQAEIASIMSVSEGSVEQYLQRAKINLRKKLSEMVGNE